MLDSGSGKMSDALDDGFRFFGFPGSVGDVGSGDFVVPITEGRLLMSGFCTCCVLPSAFDLALSLALGTTTPLPYMNEFYNIFNQGISHAGAVNIVILHKCIAVCTFLFQ
jgi:hypothetical protein